MKNYLKDVLHIKVYADGHLELVNSVQRTQQGTKLVSAPLFKNFWILENAELALMRSTWVMIFIIGVFSEIFFGLFFEEKKQNVLKKTIHQASI